MIQKCLQVIVLEGEFVYERLDDGTEFFPVGFVPCQLGLKDSFGLGDEPLLALPHKLVGACDDDVLFLYLRKLPQEVFAGLGTQAFEFFAGCSHLGVDALAAWKL